MGSIVENEMVPCTGNIICNPSSVSLSSLQRNSREAKYLCRISFCFHFEFPLLFLPLNTDTHSEREKKKESKRIMEAELVAWLGFPDWIKESVWMLWCAGAENGLYIELYVSYTKAMKSRQLKTHVESWNFIPSRKRRQAIMERLTLLCGDGNLKLSLVLMWG